MDHPFGRYGWPKAMTSYNNMLIVGGKLNIPNGADTSRGIAAWDGSTWSSLGAGLRWVKALAVYDGKLAIRELKSGKTPPKSDELERNPQITLQCLALREGFVATGDDIPYIPKTADEYHVHKFEPIKGEPELYECSVCQLEVRRFDQFPAMAIYYDLRSLIPYAADLSADWIHKGFDTGETEDSKVIKFNCPNCNGDIAISNYGIFFD